MNLEKYQKELNKTFKRNQVVLAYLFGSRARGTAAPRSDIDIAVLFSDKVKQDDYFDKRIELASEIDKALRTYKTEVICLQEAPPLLKHEAVFRGKAIFVKDRNLQFKVETRIMQEYEDTKYLRTTSYRILEEQIKKGTFGKGLLSPIEEKYLSQHVNK